MMKTCENPKCGKEFNAKAAKIRCCSQSCARQREHIVRNAARTDQDTTAAPGGYRYVWLPDHPASNDRNYVMQHRYVMEQSIGRYLTPTEHVHHKNGKRDDNRIENLELWRTKDPKGVRAADYHCHGCRCGES